jgi:hypothetical protein
MKILKPRPVFKKIAKNNVQVLTPFIINGINAELNPIFHLLALLGAHRIFHVSRIRVKHQRSASLTIR